MTWVMDTPAEPFDKAAFRLGLLATLMVAILMFSISWVVEDDIEGGYTDETQVLGETDGSQTRFSGRVLGHHEDLDCEVGIILGNSSEGPANGEELAFFECNGEDEYEQAAGVNVSWDQESGDLEVLFDSPPTAGTQVYVDISMDGTNTPSTFVIVGLATNALIIIAFLGSAIFAFFTERRAYAFGVCAGIGIAIFLSLTVAIYQDANGCGFMC
uniref:Uncharacterized protein n=1 Tax=uncultured marine group II/III euryarchaeote KM3_178_D06 TaxID=1457940 RepID=A0A075GTB2_9EURY|nr:hypothetical protein [uncultured marine group II/III euryarchaeote KM3_178_D06]